MVVLHAEKGAGILPNQVYVMPPGVHLRIIADHFDIAPAARAHGWPESISVCLHSVAESLGPRAVAVILSGDGSDGSSEMGWVKARGGVTLAQSRADHPDMPAAAEQTGYVDDVLAPGQLAAELQALAEIPVQSSDASEANGAFEGTGLDFESAAADRLLACRDVLIKTERRVRRSTISLISARRTINASSLAIARSEKLLAEQPVRGTQADTV